MKKTIKSLLLGLILVFAVALTSCVESCEHVPGASWRTSETEHWKICENCQKDVEKAAHTYGEWKTVTEPSVGEKGKEYRQCSVCGYINERDIPAIELATGVATEDTAVYAKVPADWTTVNCYFFGDDKKALDYTVGWPGATMTCVDEAENIWGYVVAPGTGYVIFNNGPTQTADLLFGTETNLYTLSSTNSEGKYIADYGTYTPAADQPELNTYPKELEEETFKTIYVQVPETWTSANIHHWGKAETAWPGVAMTVVDPERNIYTYELSSKADGFLFVIPSYDSEGKLIKDEKENYVIVAQTGNILPNEEVNAYIVTDTDGTITVKNCIYSNGTFNEVELAPEPVVFYVKGSMNGWSDNDDFKLVVDGDNATITVTFEEGATFKISTSGWDIQFNSGNTTMDASLFGADGENIKCLAAGTYKITVENFNTDTRTATIVAVVAE